MRRKWRQRSSVLEIKRKLYRIEPYLEKINKGGFCTLYYDFIRYLGLSMTEAVLLSLVFSFCMYGNDEYGYCYALKRSVCEMLGISPKTYERAMKKLISKGYIRRREVRSYGQLHHIHTVDVEKISSLCEQGRTGATDGSEDNFPNKEKSRKIVENKEKAHDEPEISVKKSFNTTSTRQSYTVTYEEKKEEDYTLTPSDFEASRQRVLSELAEARLRLERGGRLK